MIGIADWIVFFLLLPVTIFIIFPLGLLICSLLLKVASLIFSKLEKKKQGSKQEEVHPAIDTLKAELS